MPTFVVTTGLAMACACIATRPRTGGSIAGNITDNGIFAVQRTDTYSYGGVISGSGGFQQLGTGTTVLTGANSYQGPTFVSAGTLQAGAVNTFAPASACSSPGTSWMVNWV